MVHVIGENNNSRGTIQKMENNVDVSVVKAKVPLAEMFGYSTDLRSLTQGRAAYSMEFAEYVSVPDSKAQEIDRKSTRLNSSHVAISYAVFCLKKKKKKQSRTKKDRTTQIER